MNTRTIIDALNFLIERYKNELLGSHIKTVEEYKDRIGIIKGLQISIDVIIAKNSRNDD